MNSVGTWIAIAVAGGLGVAVGAAASSGSKSSSQPSPSPAPGTTWNATQGHRYSVAIYGSQTLNQVPTLAVAQAAMGPSFQLQSVTQPGANPGYINNGFTAVFDYVGQTQTGLSVQTSFAPLATSALPPGATWTAAVTDGGVTPTNPTAGPWTRATQINAGDAVRISMSAADFATIATSLGLTNDATGWGNLFSVPAVMNALGTGTSASNPVEVWAPGASLPPDWPSDDPAPASEYHAQFQYTAPVLLLVAASPLPNALWWSAQPKF